MSSVIVNLLPLIIGAAVVPIWIIIVLLLLSNKGGVLKASAFVAGIIAVRLAEGVVFGYIFRGDPAASSDEGAGLIVSTLLLVIGILMLVTAFRQWRKEDDPDAPPPKWMAAISGLSAPKAFGMGALLVAIAAKQWVFTLSAIGIIGEAQLEPPTSVGLFLFYVLAAQSLVLIPIVAYAIAPTQSAKTLDAARQWLEQYNRTIVIAISLIFGIFFLWKGVTGLIG